MLSSGNVPVVGTSLLHLRSGQSCADASREGDLLAYDALQHLFTASYLCFSRSATPLTVDNLCDLRRYLKDLQLSVVQWGWLKIKSKSFSLLNPYALIPLCQTINDIDGYSYSLWLLAENSKEFQLYSSRITQRHAHSMKVALYGALTSRGFVGVFASLNSERENQFKKVLRVKFYVKLLGGSKTSAVLR